MLSFKPHERPRNGVAIKLDERAHDALWLAPVPSHNRLKICAPSWAAESSRMASQQKRWTGKYPLGGPAEWIADGHVTCNIQCSGGKCHQRMVDVRLDTLPQDLPWSAIARRLVCKECGTAGSVHIVPNWHDRTTATVRFTKHWKT